mmetsp:Transcript_28433/g.88134  ORF Transcript_28433/g.88134 Transcript_28433/m.88134 type:complete len:285 (+) Transcript_28433:884-1738(+)
MCIRCTAPRFAACSRPRTAHRSLLCRVPSCARTMAVRSSASSRRGAPPDQRCAAVGSMRWFSTGAALPVRGRGGPRRPGRNRKRSGTAAVAPSSSVPSRLPPPTWPGSRWAWPSPPRSSSCSPRPRPQPATQPTCSTLALTTSSPPLWGFTWQLVRVPTSPTSGRRRRSPSSVGWATPPLIPVRPASRSRPRSRPPPARWSRATPTTQRRCGSSTCASSASSARRATSATSRSPRCSTRPDSRFSRCPCTKRPPWGCCKKRRTSAWPSMPAAATRTTAMSPSPC